MIIVYCIISVKVFMLYYVSISILKKINNIYVMVNKINDLDNYEKNIELLKLVWFLRNFSLVVLMLLKIVRL